MYLKEEFKKICGYVTIQEVQKGIIFVCTRIKQNNGNSLTNLCVMPTIYSKKDLNFLDRFDLEKMYKCREKTKTQDFKYS